MTAEERTQLKAQFISTLRDVRGVEALARTMTGISKATLRRWLTDDPGFRDAFDDSRDVVLDLAEQKLADLIESGDKTTIMFILKTRGRTRGYGEKLDVKVDLTLENKLPLVSLGDPRNED